jgi:hypothetical protein
MHEHVDSIKTYTLVFFSLLALTAATTAVAYTDLGPFNIVMALFIAVLKMLLVAAQHHPDQSRGRRRDAVAGHPSRVQPRRLRHARLAAGAREVAGPILLKSNCILGMGA